MPDLAEQILELLTDPTSGRPLVSPAQMDAAVAGALLLDLLAGGRVRTVAEGRRRSARRWEVVDPPLTGDAVLDGAAAVLAAGRVSTFKAVDLLAPYARTAVLRVLVSRDVLRHERVVVGGVFRVDRWLPAAAANRPALRQRLASVLVGDAPPSGDAAPLIALLDAANALALVFGEVPRKKAARVLRLIEADWREREVRAAVLEVVTALEERDAVLAAVAAAAAAT